MTTRRTKRDLEIQPIDWPAPVLRVGLRWDGEKWSTGHLVRVPSMTLPKPADIAPDAATGFWVEAFDAQGRLRYRELLADPLLGMEFFEADGAITRATHKGHAIDFEVLVPDAVPVTELLITSNVERQRGVKPYEVRLLVDREPVDQSPHDPPAPGHGDHHH